MSNARAGTISLAIDGEMQNLAGSFVINTGKVIREGLVGLDGVHGYKETNTIPFVEGEIRDGQKVSLDKISKITDATITVQLVNGKTYTYQSAWSCNTDGLAINTEEGTIPVRFEALSCQEIM